jgi:hypothetical protein
MPDEIIHQQQGGRIMGLSINDVKTSKFLKKEDIGEGKLVTISEVTRENVAADGAEAEYKVCVKFLELEKPLILNSTNAQIIAKITGYDDDIDRTWIGKKIVLYVDDNVTMHGKIVGGIRVRKPRPGAVLDEPKTINDDLPF